MDIDKIQEDKIGFLVDLKTKKIKWFEIEVQDTGENVRMGAVPPVDALKAYGFGTLHLKPPEMDGARADLTYCTSRYTSKKGLKAIRIIVEALTHELGKGTFNLGIHAIPDGRWISEVFTEDNLNEFEMVNPRRSI